MPERDRDQSDGGEAVRGPRAEPAGALKLARAEPAVAGRVTCGGEAGRQELEAPEGEVSAAGCDGVCSQSHSTASRWNSSIFPDSL